MRATFALVLAVAVPGFAVANDVTVGAFSQGDLSGWETEVFNAETGYALVEGEAGTVLKAEANASASGLFKKIKIDLSQTPCLKWRWKVDGTLQGLNETIKAGDDYAARVYVVVSTGPFFWQTRAISYVWSGSRPVGDVWPNAYTDKATMVAMQSGNARAGQWVLETRNVLADVQRFVGEDMTTVDAVALMSDTDDSGLSATAYYGDIFLTSCD
ncbi:DUF3047 domain-containing protein [Magnetovibrio sp. PR-2]|uniref:DUF3047 domain-containing protein n=1 Tax=Magnetovibrio sp. PR-2 TaxID=3120356 RepID=UPI002FCE36BA